MKPKSLFEANRFPNSKHLDFGCGKIPRNPFSCRQLFTVDLYKAIPEDHNYIIELGEQLPFPDNFFDSVSAYDVLEHLSRDTDGKNLFIYYMNELCRVLKPDGFAVFVFPAFPHKDAFSDPTHVNYITDETLNYFLGDNVTSSYAGVRTTYKQVRNGSLRLWKNWVEIPQETNSERSSIRRKLSLAKRDVFRALKPGHRIWILQKLNN